jgi:hypothetical protein
LEPTLADNKQYSTSGEIRVRYKILVKLFVFNFTSIHFSQFQQTAEHIVATISKPFSGGGNLGKNLSSYGNAHQGVVRKN